MSNISYGWTVPDFSNERETPAPVYATCDDCNREFEEQDLKMISGQNACPECYKKEVAYAKEYEND